MDAMKKDNKEVQEKIMVLQKEKDQVSTCRVTEPIHARFFARTRYRLNLVLEFCGNFFVTGYDQNMEVMI